MAGSIACTYRVQPEPRSRNTPCRHQPTIDVSDGSSANHRALWLRICRGVFDAKAARRLPALYNSQGAANNWLSEYDLFSDEATSFFDLAGSSRSYGKSLDAEDPGIESDTSACNSLPSFDDFRRSNEKDEPAALSKDYVAIGGWVSPSPTLDNGCMGLPSSLSDESGIGWLDDEMREIESSYGGIPGARASSQVRSASSSSALVGNFASDDMLFEPTVVEN
jgi:hypothetical protein